MFVLTMTSILIFTAVFIAVCFIALKTIVMYYDYVEDFNLDNKLSKGKPASLFRFFSVSVGNISNVKSVIMAKEKHVNHRTTCNLITKVQERCEVQIRIAVDEMFVRESYCAIMVMANLIEHMGDDATNLHLHALRGFTNIPEYELSNITKLLKSNSMTNRYNPMCADIISVSCGVLPDDAKLREVACTALFNHLYLKYKMEYHPTITLLEYGVKNETEIN